MAAAATAAAAVLRLSAERGKCGGARAFSSSSSSSARSPEPVATSWRGAVAAAATVLAGYAWSSRGGGDGSGGDAVRPVQQQDERWESAALTALPPLDVAQRTRAVRRPRLLSEAEIEELLRAVECMRRDGAGRYARDASGVQQLGAAPWETVYLHTDGGFGRHCAGLRQKLLDEARAVDREQGWGLLRDREASCGPIRFRTAEYHEVTVDGALPNPRHFDGGSLVTIDVMLERPGVDFEGGAFTTEEEDGSVTEHTFERGDATFFVSHKYHSVQPVTAGRRAVLVCELWHGPERSCAHRCLQRTGECDYTAAAANAERLLKGETPDLY